jgi:hypothetical protein
MAFLWFIIDRVQGEPSLDIAKAADLRPLFDSWQGREVSFFVAGGIFSGVKLPVRKPDHLPP